jgi:hypothetical protein
MSIDFRSMCIGFCLGVALINGVWVYCQLRRERITKSLGKPDQAISDLDEHSRAEPVLSSKLWDEINDRPGRSRS